MPTKGQEERGEKIGRVPGCVLALTKSQLTQQGAPTPCRYPLLARRDEPLYLHRAQSLAVGCPERLWPQPAGWKAKGRLKALHSRGMVLRWSSEQHSGLPPLAAPYVTWIHFSMCVMGATSPGFPWASGSKRRIRTGMLHQTTSLMTVGGLEAITDTRYLSVIIYLNSAPFFPGLSCLWCCDPNPHLWGVCTVPWG